MEGRDPAMILERDSRGTTTVTKSNAKDRAKSGVAAGVLLAAAVSLLALPTAVLAFATKFEPVVDLDVADDSLESLGAVESAAQLSRAIPVRSLAKGQLYAFTPADTPNRPDRAITVAVRVNPEAAKALSVRRPVSALASAGDGGELRIAPTAFNLGVSRGYKNFSQGLVASEGKITTPIPNLEKFSIKSAKTGDDPRFSPRIVMDETQSAGRTPRTFAGDGDDRVDVGGSYRVTENLDVTAGVRYSQERERLLPALTDGKQDNQAVYVGTQFRF